GARFAHCISYFTFYHCSVPSPFFQYCSITYHACFSTAALRPLPFIFLKTGMAIGLFQRFADTVLQAMDIVYPCLLIECIVHLKPIIIRQTIRLTLCYVWLFSFDAT